MKILIIKPSSFGDIVQANPTLVALKKAYPNAACTWLVFDKWADILSLFPDVAKTIVWNREGGLKEYARVLKAIRSEKFDLAVDLQGLARTAFLTAFSKARTRIGVPGMKEFSWLLVKEVFPESKTLNAALRSLETVRFLTGIPGEPAFNVIVSSAQYYKAKETLLGDGIKSTDKLIGIVPFARGKAKEWPLGHYKELIETALSSSKDLKVLVFGDNKTQRNAFMEHSRIINLSGRTSLSDLGAYMRLCRVIIGGDTGPVHLASSLGIPVVTIFGGSDVGETAPIARNAKILKKEFDCSPCRSRPACKDFPCLKAITPKEVHEAMARYL